MAAHGSLVQDLQGPIVMTAHTALLSDRAVLEVGREDRAHFLQGLVTNDVAGLKEGEARFAGLLTPQGKILFDFFVVARGDRLLLDCPAALAAELAKRLSLYKLRAKVTVADVSAHFSVAAAWGGSAAEWARANAAVAYADPRLPALGLRVIFDRTGAPAFSAQFEDYEAMRVGLALPEGGKDYAYGDAFPHEACYDFLHGVSFKKGCFVGQEVVSRMQHRGTARSRILAVSALEPLSQGGADILADGLAVGRLGTVAGKSGVAMARLDRVGQAVHRGQSFTAGGIAVELSVPAWADYSLDPAPAEAGR
jgi:tRNA-modifying protein YgfZ